MQTIKVILNERGQLDTILSDDEVNLEVLRHGKDDNKIDEFESILDVVDYE
jgi:hypothetical protein